MISYLTDTPEHLGARCPQPIRIALRSEVFIDWLYNAGQGAEGMAKRRGG